MTKVGDKVRILDNVYDIGIPKGVTPFKGLTGTVVEVRDWFEGEFVDYLVDIKACSHTNSWIFYSEEFEVIK